MKLRSRSSMLALVSSALVAAAVLPLSAHAAEEASIGRRYHDKLDSRLSAISLAQATRDIGYTARGYSGGRDVDDAFIDGLRSSVFGLFGHGNRGILQTDEGPTNAEDHIFAAGNATDVVSVYKNLRYFTEYIPFVEVDDMRLLIAAACYTSGTSEWGNFLAAGKARGIDSVVTFRDLVYFPATTSGTAVSQTNYSGNYYWHRFSYHIKQGVTVATALARATTDLVAKEGNSGGWNRYIIGGAVANPGGVKLKPAGNGVGGNSQPLAATSAYDFFAELTPVSSTVIDDPDGLSTIDVATAEGVSYRMRRDGSVLDAVGIAAQSGDVTLSESEALSAAERFVRRNVDEFSSAWLVTENAAASHTDGEALVRVQWRTDLAGRPGSRAVTVEIDRRTGAITYFAEARGTADTAGFAVSAAQAIAMARGEFGDQGVATVEADTWDTSRWTVTIDRGLMGRPGAEVPDVKRMEIDAGTGEILSRTSA